MELYRKADADTREAALKVLRGEAGSDLLSGLLESAIGLLGGKK